MRGRDNTIAVGFPPSSSDRAVSPVIAVALMVGLAVALAGVLGVAATDFLDDIGSNPDATVTFSQDGSEVDVTIQEVGDDVTSMSIRGDAQDGSFSSIQAGSVATVTQGPDGSGGTEPLAQGDRITVIANDGNGNENTVGVYVVGETTS